MKLSWISSEGRFKFNGYSNNAFNHIKSHLKNQFLLKKLLIYLLMFSNSLTCMHLHNIHICIRILIHTYISSSSSFIRHANEFLFMVNGIPNGKNESLHNYGIFTLVCYGQIKWNDIINYSTGRSRNDGHVKSVKFCQLFQKLQKC